MRLPFVFSPHLLPYTYFCCSNEGEHDEHSTVGSPMTIVFPSEQM